MPGTNDLQVYSCAADGLVMHTHASGTRQWKCNQGMVHKLCMNPHFPSVFYSCGEDGTVRFYDVREPHCCGEDLEDRTVRRFRFLSARGSSFCNSSVLVNLGYNAPIHSIAINPIHPVHFVIGGEKGTLQCYDIRFLRSSVLHNYNSDSALVAKFESDAEHDSFGSLGVTGVAYSNDGAEILASYSSDRIYLFDCKNPNSGSTTYDIPDFQRGASINSLNLEAPTIGKKRDYSGHVNYRTVKEVNFFGHKSEYIVSGSDDGKIYLWQKESKKLVKVLEGDEDVVNCVQSHPFKPELATR